MQIKTASQIVVKEVFFLRSLAVMAQLTPPSAFLTGETCSTRCSCWGRKGDQTVAGDSRFLQLKQLSQRTPGHHCITPTTFYPSRFTSSLSCFSSSPALR